MHTEYRVLERHLYTELSDELEIHFLNLVKAKKHSVEAEPNEKAERLADWLRFIETDEREVRAMPADSSPVMGQANETVDVMLHAPKERWLYENRMKYEHDKASWEHVGYIKGVAEGEAVGFDRGFRQKALETARRMRIEKLGVDLISKVTGLSKEEIAQL